MKKIILLILISFSIKSFANENVLTIGDENVSLKEFENIFFKNNDLESFTKEYLDEYMELFINFKLKVKEASDENCQECHLAFPRSITCKFIIHDLHMHHNP